MNIEFEQSREENFSRACYLCDGKFSRTEIFNFLKNGNLPERQFAALEVDSIKTQEEAETIINNLTGCDGKIREAVAFKLTELLPQCKNFFYPYAEIFAYATIDINANISRMVIDVLSCFKEDKDFANTYVNKIFGIIYEALKTYDGFIFKDKKYTINKQLFRIYWCIEGFNVFFEFVDKTRLYSILEYCAKIPEYTIREKVAMILNRDNLPEEFVSLKQSLKSDENYYVRKF